MKPKEFGSKVFKWYYLGIREKFPPTPLRRLPEDLTSTDAPQVSCYSNDLNIRDLHGSGIDDFRCSFADTNELTSFLAPIEQPPFVGSIVAYWVKRTASLSLPRSSLERLIL